MNTVFGAELIPHLHLASVVFITATAGSKQRGVTVPWPTTEVVVDSITLLDRKRREEDQPVGAA